MADHGFESLCGMPGVIFGNCLSALLGEAVHIEHLTLRRPRFKRAILIIITSIVVIHLLILAQTL